MCREHFGSSNHFPLSTLIAGLGFAGNPPHAHIGALVCLAANAGTERLRNSRPKPAFQILSLDTITNIQPKLPLCNTLSGLFIRFSPNTNLACNYPRVYVFEEFDALAFDKNLSVTQALIA